MSGLDADALRAKYRHERDRRLRDDGNDQYRQVAGALAGFAGDPGADPSFHREPLHDEVDVAIIGAGFGGLLAGARLREAGVQHLRLIEAGADVGGTWYWNRYPGAQCDVESYCYLPLLEELGVVPSEKYARAPEIHAHARRIASAFGLAEATCLQTRVTDLRWDAACDRWTIATDRGDAMRARFVITATGLINRPKLPAVPGIEDFRGRAFHTSRWDYAYTGGDHHGGLHRLADKRVAVIGTGASAIQCVPYLGAHAKHLTVFQRTPSSVGPRGNRPTDPQWARSLRPGWQRERRENFNDILHGLPFERDLVDDGWTSFFRALAAALPQADASSMDRVAEEVDAAYMEAVRARVAASVRDPATAEALKPWYRLFCKRPTFNDDYLPTFDRPNVTLVDVSGSRGVERITAHGVVAHGIEHPVDCIVFATGFEVGTPSARRNGFEVTGIDGLTLGEHWAQGLRTLHGFTSRGFPNLFGMGVSQNAVSVNITSMLDDQAQHLAWLVREALGRGLRSLQPTAEAEQAWVDLIRGGGTDERAREFLQACTPGYYNGEGRLGQRNGTLTGGTYAAGVSAFNRLLADWRAEGSLAGMELR